MNIRQSYLILVLLLGCVAWQAQAGVVIQQVERSVGSTEAKQTVTLTMDAGKLRVEGSGSGQYLLIFDNGKQVMWMVDLQKKTYFEMTKAQVEGMANQMQQAMKQMEEAMANVPPEQRAMMERMMKGRMGAMAGMAAPPQITVEDKGSSDTVGPFSCKQYNVLTNGQVSSEICAADPSQMKLDASAMETFKALGDFFEPLRRIMPQAASGWSTPDAMDQIQGFPVRTITYDGGKPSTEWVFEKLEERAIDAGQFALPSGLKKQEMPKMPQMGR